MGSRSPGRGRAQRSGNAHPGWNARGVGAALYSSTFGFTENPISDGGLWKHNTAGSGAYGTSPFAYLATNGTAAYGTQTGTDTGNARYSDSYGYQVGFGTNYIVTGTVRRNGTISGGFHEMALLLRWSDGVNLARGYECGFAWDGAYAGVTRWNGNQADFTSPSDWQVSSIGAFNDGDVIVASIIGRAITVKRNGTTIYSVADISKSTDLAVGNGTNINGAVWDDGNPGLACYRNGTSTNSDDLSWDAVTILAA